MTKEWESPYATFSNNPILNIDPNGDSDSTYKTPGGGTVTTDDPGAKTFDGKAYKVGNATVQPAKGTLKSFTVTGDQMEGGAARFVAMFDTKTGAFTGYGWDKKPSWTYADYLKESGADLVRNLEHANDPMWDPTISREQARKNFINNGLGVILPTVLIRPLTIATAIKKIPNISYLTKAGNYPAWSTVKTRYWNLMNKGKVPTGMAQVRMRTSGEIMEIAVSKELHHINGRAGVDPHNYSNLKEVWPWEHAAIDASRNTGYDFIKWIK